MAECERCRTLEAALRECLIDSPHSDWKPSCAIPVCLCRWCKARAALAAQPAQEVPPLPVVRPNEWCPRCNSYHFAPKPEEGQR